MGCNKVVVYLLVFGMLMFSLGSVLGQLTAGDFDDNLNYGYFLDYIDKSQQNDQSGVLPQLNFKDRVTLHIIDKNEVGVSNAFVSVTPYGEQEPILESYSGTNGVFHFFPYIDGVGSYTNFNMKIGSPDSEIIETKLTIDLNELTGDRTLEVMLDDYESALPNSLDLMFVIDTTGSMSDELNYLTAEFQNIIGQIENKYPQVVINFGLVVYRDQGDIYVVRDYDFTDSLEKMQEQLDAQRAEGGGDYPEAMDQALNKALNYQWRAGNTARMLFLVADAPPHDNKLQATMDNVILARKQGIHIFPIAASGVLNTAEYIMRTAACLTNGRYIFLTDDSGIGNPHAEPHIPGYVATHLDDLFVRVVGSELIGKRIEAEDNEIIRHVGNVENGVVYPIKEWEKINEQNENTTDSSKDITDYEGNTTNSTYDKEVTEPEDSDGEPDDDLYIDSDEDLKSMDFPTLLDAPDLLSADHVDMEYFESPSDYPRDSGDGESDDTAAYYESYSISPLFILILISIVVICICIPIVIIVIEKKKNRRGNKNITQKSDNNAQYFSKPINQPVTQKQNISNTEKSQVQKHLNNSNDMLIDNLSKIPTQNKQQQSTNFYQLIQQPQQTLCSTCNLQLTYIPSYDKYYCYHCQKYE